MNNAFMIIKASRLLKAKLDQALKPYDITAAQFSVMNQIYNNEQITLVEIANRLSSDKPTISGIINRLESKGILIKMDNPYDKRSSYLSLTPVAIDMMKEVIKISDLTNREVFSAISQDENKNLNDNLNQIIKILENE